VDSGTVVTALAGGGAGALAGVVVRVALARMRRGVLVPVVPCAVALAVLWAVPCGLVAGGVVATAWLPAWLGLGVLVVGASAADLAAQRLPDALTRPATVLALVSVLPLGLPATGAGLLGGVLLSGAFAAVHLAAPRALGAGDVKLAPAVGVPLAAASWAAPAVAPVLAAAGVLALVTVSALTRRGRPATVPYAPPLLLAAWAVLTVSLTAG
jgi:leader peptidase (prepilin peptidase) / N-methyltransferase